MKELDAIETALWSLPAETRLDVGAALATIRRHIADLEQANRAARDVAAQMEARAEAAEQRQRELKKQD